MNTSAWQKYMKILALFFIVLDAIFIVMFALCAAGVFSTETSLMMLNADPEDVGTDVANVIAASLPLYAGMMIFGYAINLICTYFVYRGAKNPAKMKPGMILYGILSVLCAITLVSNIVNGTFQLSVVSQCLITWIFFYGALQINKLAK